MSSMSSPGSRINHIAYDEPTPLPPPTHPQCIYRIQIYAIGSWIARRRRGQYQGKGRPLWRRNHIVFNRPISQLHFKKDSRGEFPAELLPISPVFLLCPSSPALIPRPTANQFHFQLEKIPALPDPLLTAKSGLFSAAFSSGIRLSVAGSVTRIAGRIWLTTGQLFTQE